MKSRWIEQSMIYDGTQLRSLFAYLKLGLLGDSIVSWSGPCQVDFQHMVDGEDLLAQSKICGDHMLHFIIEKFDSTLFTGVALQRLLASICCDLLRQKGIETIRDGDDLFWNLKKLSISIASQSPISTLIHFAMNVTNDGTPVSTISLSDFQIDPKSFANEIMDLFCKEIHSIQDATQKVKWVK